MYSLYRRSVPLSPRLSRNLHYSGTVGHCPSHSKGPEQCHPTSHRLRAADSVEEAEFHVNCVYWFHVGVIFAGGNLYLKNFMYGKCVH
ncbi:hypothetical protein ACOMHN_026372 [Nucella lapillus]